MTVVQISEEGSSENKAEEAFDDETKEEATELNAPPDRFKFVFWIILLCGKNFVRKSWKHL